MQDYRILERLKGQLDEHRPLPDAVLARLRENLVLDWTYHSNAIEGNSLTLLETKVVLEGITVGGKTMREHLEVINHSDAINYIESLVQESQPLSEWHIKNIHQLVLKQIDNDNAGVYRKVSVRIGGARHIPPEPVVVAGEMQNFIRWYTEEALTLHPVERAARVHADFIGIHPFIDGNGRTSRLLMNAELMKAGYPAAIIAVDQRFFYYHALDKVHTEKNYDPFIKLVCQAIENGFKPYWHALGITPCTATSSKKPDITPSMCL